MADIDCTKCTAECCRVYEVEITRDEYDALSDHASVITKKSDQFVELFPDFTAKQSLLDKLLSDGFAILDKGRDGYCQLLDRDTRLCTVYNRRPRACKEYKTDRCGDIRCMSM